MTDTVSALLSELIPPDVAGDRFDWALDKAERLAEIMGEALALITTDTLTLYVKSLTAAGDPSVFDEAWQTWTLFADEVVGEYVAGMYLAGEMAAAKDAPNVTAWIDSAGSDPRAAEQVASWASVVNNQAVEYQQSATNRIKGLSNEVWMDVQRKAAANIDTGMAVDKLAAEVKGITDYSRSRSMAIARTETMGAFSGGTVAGARALGDNGPVAKRWLATGGPRTRPSHVEANGQLVAMPDSFTVGGVAMDRPLDPAAPAAEVVNCRCTVLLMYPGDPELDGTEWETIEPEQLPSWSPEPFVGELRIEPLAPNLGGQHPKQILLDADGNRYLFKPQERWLAHGEAAASEISLRAGLNVPRVTIHEFNGQVGSLQRMIPNFRPGFGSGPASAFDPTKISKADLEVVQQHRVLDWLIGNHDGHANQYVRDGYANQGGKLTGIDKGQAFKYHGRGEKLDYKWKPPDRLSDPDSVGAAVDRAYVEGRLSTTQFLKTFNKNAVSDTAKRLQAIPDDEFRAMLRPYAEGRWSANGYGMDGGDIEKFLDEMVARKNTLTVDFDRYHRRLQAAHFRNQKKLAPKQPSMGGTGGPKGMAGAPSSQFTMEFAEEHDHPLTSPTGHADLKSYTSSSYVEINYALRSGGTERRVAGIRRSMSPLKKDIIVHRGTSLTDIMPNRSMTDIQGAVFRERGFMSTFIDSSRGSPGIASGDTGINLRLNAGQRGAWVDSISAHKGEREFVVEDDSYIYVHSVRKSTGQGWESRYTWIVDAEAVTKEWAAKAGVRVWDPGTRSWMN